MRAPIRHGGGVRLSELLAGIITYPAAPDRRRVTGLAMDSRQVQAGDCFLACQGTLQHGREYIDQALKLGAGAVLIEADHPLTSTSSIGAVPWIAVPDLRAQAGIIADRFYGHPSAALLVIGVTGTNGKTSISHFIAQAVNDTWRRGPCGVLGTLGYGLLPRLESATTTTPDPITLHRLLAELRDRQARSVVLEVSSHGLEQGRVAGIKFAIAVFTNLGRDHLDYHGSMEAYGQAKLRLFQRPDLRAAVINLDDPFGQAILTELPSGVRVFGYTLGPTAPSGCPAVGATHLAMSKQGVMMEIVAPSGRGILKSSLLGRFNAYNLLAALAVLLELGIPLDEALERLARVTSVAGRMECLQRDPWVIVDYAHTPQGLEQALRTLREVCSGRLWCVFGCGGERDSGKRPLMGQVAEALADHLILTTDNPRSEAPAVIVQGILSGIEHKESVCVELDRAKAIEQAILHAHEEDTVLVAGKGHETYQEIRGRRLPFSDSEVVRHITERRAFA